MLAIPARVIATSFALTCFAATVIVGLYNGNGWTSILFGGLGVLVLAYIVGRIIGGIALRGIDEQIARHKEQNPFPEEDAAPAVDTPPDTSQAQVV